MDVRYLYLSSKLLHSVSRKTLLLLVEDNLDILYKTQSIVLAELSCQLGIGAVLLLGRHLRILYWAQEK